MQSFRERYEAAREPLSKAAEQLQDFLEAVLRENLILFLSVSVRVKTLDSATRKIAKKGYTDPWAQMMDLIGARIFTYFRPDAALVERVIRSIFTVHDEHCKNATDELAYNTFGYTSRHLVCSLNPNFPDLRIRSLVPEGLKLEFQIRSVLEHGWAEIEHEIVYKSGTHPPDTIRRRFAASAAALEIVELEFDRLRSFEITLAEERVLTISRHLSDLLDRAWFVAVLMKEYPDRKTWNPDPQENVFFRSYELLLIDSLRANGVDTVGGFRSRLRRPRVKRLVGEYAQRRGLDVALVSHLPIAIFATFFDSASAMPVELRRVCDHEITELLKLQSH